MEDIPLRQLELSFIEKFDSFMRIEQGFTAHTVSSYTIILRKIIRRTISQGLLHKNPFAAYIPEQPPRKRRHMTQEELDKFISVPIASKQVCHTRDMFLFSTFTGLSYADMRNLSEEHIFKERDGSYWVKIKRQKINEDMKKLSSRIGQEYRLSDYIGNKNERNHEKQKNNN